MHLENRRLLKRATEQMFNGNKKKEKRKFKWGKKIFKNLHLSYHHIHIFVFMACTTDHVGQLLDVHWFRESSYKYPDAYSK